MRTRRRPLVRQTVIFVDDEDESLTHALYDSLAPEEWEVMFAESPEEALKMCDETEANLIMMVIDSRATESWAVLDEMTETNPLLPIIVVTGRPELRDLAEAVGARALVVTPFEVQTLLRTMRELLVTPVEEARFKFVPVREEEFREMLLRRYATRLPLIHPNRRHGKEQQVKGDA